MGEREPHRHQTPVEQDALLLRGVRSLAWNRHLLPLIQARLERAENIVRSQILRRGEQILQIGPFGISLDEDQEIVLTWQASEDWEQLYLPEPDPLIGDPLDAPEHSLP